MARFKKKKDSGQVTINTSSLPDIIFMLLFFFMVATTMRETTIYVKVTAPEAHEIQKLDKTSNVYLYVGVPTQAEVFGTDSRIQCNDVFVDMKDVGVEVINNREQLDESKRKKMTVAMRIDQDTKMGIVTDIKQELRSVGAFKINYTTRKKSK